jgi:hypothetical protein
MGPRLLILVPLLISLVIARRSLEKALLNVYLPVLLCFPVYEFLKLPNLPFLTFSETAVLPIGILLIVRKRREWRFTRMDFWMLLFGISSCATYFLHVPNPTVGTYNLISWLLMYFFPYAIGKLLIEQDDLRTKVMKRFVILLAFVALGCVFEYRMGVDPFHDFWHRLIPPEGPVSGLDHTQVEQVRWGFTRAAGPYAGSEAAGMVYIFGMIFAYALYKNQQWERKFRWKFHPFQKGTLLLLITTIGLFVTQARGAYLGVALGYVIARIASAKNIKKASIYTALFLAFVAVPSYKALSSYASVSSSSVDDDRGDAVYRAIMIQNYLPVMEAGGPFGWVEFPVIDGQTSIDNEYLFVGLTQGYVGAIAFSLLIVESFLAVFRSLRRTQNQEDIVFIFCVAGGIAGMALCIGTVFVSSPVSELLFLLIGWSQSVRCTETSAPQLAPVASSGVFQYRRVFT